MIKNVVLNVSNILTHFGWREFLMGLGFSGENMGKFYEEIIFNKYWEKFIEKKVTLNDLCEKLYNNYVLNIDKSSELCVRIQKDPSALEHIILSVLTHLDELVDRSVETEHWVRDIKKSGFKVFIICNYQIAALQLKIKHESDILALADGKIIGSCENLSFPEKESFKYTLDTYSLIAKECVYIDDYIENIDRAKELGMKGIVFTDYKETLYKIQTFEQECM